MTLEQDYMKTNPDGFFVDPQRKSELETYLRRHNWLASSENISQIASAGDGNMNLTLRIETSSKRSFILKQARPWCEKYPQISAPTERVLTEAAFYRRVQSDPTLAKMTPAMTGLDESAKILVFEDLGPSQDYTSLYSGQILSTGELKILVGFLNDLHSSMTSKGPRSPLPNRSMRALNHEYIFRQPLEPGSSAQLEAIEPGLGALAGSLKRDSEFVSRAHDLGEIYLSDGITLVHGDYIPGAWLRAPRGICVIDPEFAFYGAAEIDVGFLMAHLLMARQPLSALKAVEREYDASDDFDWATALGFAGMEVMRRIIGVAQLPLGNGLSFRQSLLEIARSLVVEGVWSESICERAGYRPWT